MYQNRKAEEKTGVEVTESQRKIIGSSPQDTSRCDGCPYPRVGFICWSPDGSCMKTDVDKINRSKKGR